MLSEFGCDMINIKGKRTPSKKLIGSQSIEKWRHNLILEYHGDLQNFN